MELYEQVHTELTYEFNFVVILYKCDIVSLSNLDDIDRRFQEDYIARIAQRSRAPAL